MLAIALCSMKGGTGKTTLAYNLAERACTRGYQAALLDYDPQEGSIGLADLREASGWPVFSSRVGVPGAEYLAGLRETGTYDVLVCDLPGSDSMALGRLLMEMDLVLSPVGAGPSDLMTAGNFAWLVRGMSLPVVFVPNNVPQGRVRREDMLAELEGFQLEVCPVAVQRRVAHLDALRAGLGVCEAFPRSTAAREVDALWAWVCGRLGIGPCPESD
jgi:chromosome partitioning protein